MTIKYITGGYENVRPSAIKSLEPRKQGIYILFRNGTEGMAETINGYKVLVFFKHLYVLKQCLRNGEGTNIPDANFMGTGMALCAVLKEGQFHKFLKNEI